MATITAPDRASRHVATPILLPESDMAARGGPAPLLALVRASGRIVMDDVTPLRALPGGTENPPAHDAKREFFFGTSQLVAAEVVLPDLENSLLVGTKAGG